MHEIHLKTFFKSPVVVQYLHFTFLQMTEVLIGNVLSPLLVHFLCTEMACILILGGVVLG